MTRTAPSTRMIHDDEFFRLAWRSKVKVEAVAQIYGTSRAAIYRAANRFGHGHRKVIVEAECQPDPKPETYEGQLIWSRGRWGILRDISADWHRSFTQVQVDFHRARANAQKCSDRPLAEGG